MTMIGWKERQERIEARGAEYRSGAMTEAQFSACLFGLRLRGDDITHELRNYAPPPARQTFEERRMEISHRWIGKFLSRG